MQSFLQYRRFKKHATRQYERDREKAEALRRGNDALGLTSSAVSTTAKPSPATSDETIDTRDPERAEHSKGDEVHNEPKGLPPIAEEDTEEEEHPEPRPPLMSRASTAATQRTMGTALGTALTGINVRKRTTKEGGDKGTVFVVGYEGEQDNMNPHNWSFIIRLRATYVDPPITERSLTPLELPLQPSVGSSGSPLASTPPLSPKQPKTLESAKWPNPSRLVSS
jgi:hypothetical protein